MVWWVAGFWKKGGLRNKQQKQQTATRAIVALEGVGLIADAGNRSVGRSRSRRWIVNGIVDAVVRLE